MAMNLQIQPFEAALVHFNKDEMAAAVKAFTERYEGLVVTDKAEAKQDRAEINRILKQIDDARKQVKRAYEFPLKAFEADLKEIVEPLKNAGAAIDQQIKTIEENERMERKAALEEVYASTTRSVPFSRVFDTRWLNSSTTMKKATEGLTEALEKAEADMRVICSLQSENIPALVKMYNDGASLSEVMNYDKELRQTALSFNIKGTETVEDVIDQLEKEDPRNEYTATEVGIQVTAKPTARRVLITCTDAEMDKVTALLDSLGVFYVVD